MALADSIKRLNLQLPTAFQPDDLKAALISQLCGVPMWADGYTETISTLASIGLQYVDWHQLAEDLRDGSDV